MLSFDQSAQETERTLRDLRHLAAGIVIPTEEQEALLERLVALLHETKQVADRLRRALLEEAAPPQPERPGNP